MSNLLNELLLEENELQFNTFNEETAWQIGYDLVERAKKNNLPIAIDINRANRQLFHASLPGATIDNAEWIKRKVRLVYRFGHSSFYIGQQLKKAGKTIKENSLLQESEFAPQGGCFPIIIKGTGIIGTITVSGLPQEEDHKLVVTTIRNYLQGA
jgi:uncharacterized protein (UPF0303 family)